MAFPGYPPPAPTMLARFTKQLVGRGPVYYAWRRARTAWVRLRSGLRHVHPTAYVHPSAEVRADLVCHEWVLVSRGCQIMPGVEIGRYTMLAPNVSIVGADHLFDKPGVPIFFSGRPPNPKTSIGADVWLGTGVVVMQGKSVGRGSIVAANAVVTKDIPPYEIWAGVPARKIGERFADPAERARHDEMLDGPVMKPDMPESR